MVRRFIPLLALSSLGVADVTLTITKTWLVTPYDPHS